MSYIQVCVQHIEYNQVCIHIHQTNQSLVLTMGRAMVYPQHIYCLHKLIKLENMQYARNRLYFTAFPNINKAYLEVLVRGSN